MIFQAILLASSSVLPSAPIAVQQPAIVKPHNFNWFDYTLYGSIAGYRAMDYWTTETILSQGGHEVELPQSFVASKAGFAAFSFGMAGLEIGASVWAHKHGHAKLARVADTLSNVAGWATQASNLSQPGVRW